MNEYEIRDRSYEIRHQLIELGVISKGDGLLVRDHLMLATVDGAETDCILIGITNAGFRGIEARIELADRTRRTISLGHVTSAAN